MIDIRQISFRIGDFHLRELSLTIRAGEYFVLMGPPGSGKSVLMECVCGLKQPEAGRILIDGRDVTDLPPRRRALGYVPQDYALFPHRNVANNINFPLRRLGVGRGPARQRTQEVAGMLGIRHLLGRSVVGLSGGEQQRVAVARAVVMRPKVLLLDEPVSALDDATRQSVCFELKSLQRKLGITTVHICHNREEAFSVAERAAVLCDGRLQQSGPLGELLRQPGNEFVARFLGCENLYEGEAGDTDPGAKRTTVKLSGARFLIQGLLEGKVRFIVRPENVQLSRGAQQASSEDTQICVKLIEAIDCGAYVRVRLDGAVPLVSYLSHAAFGALGASAGEDLLATIRIGAIHPLPG